MPLTEGDVLDTLSDSVALGIEFYVDKIHIKGEYLTTVRDHIRAGNILVKGGTQDLAFYDQATDVLLTQKKSPPANDSDRALLLHECVHAMIDVYDPDGAVTRHMGELAAYLTQTTYSVRKNPSSNRNGTAPWDKFWGDLYATVRANKLDTSAGNPVGRSKSPGYGHLKLPHLMIAVSAAEQQ
ncbi:antirestriction protein ArdC [Bradyrhizobium japonicum]